MMTAVNSNERHFGRDRQVNRALNISEAGLNSGGRPPEGVAREHDVALPGYRHHRRRARGRTPQRGHRTRPIRISTSGRSRPRGSRPTARSSGSRARRSTRRSRTIRRRRASEHARVAGLHLGFFMGDTSSNCTTVSGSGNTSRGTATYGSTSTSRVALHAGQLRHPPADRHLGDPHRLHRRQVPVLGQQRSTDRHVQRQDQAGDDRGRLSRRNSSAVTCSSSANSHVYSQHLLRRRRPDITKPAYRHELVHAERHPQAGDRLHPATTIRPGTRRTCLDLPERLHGDAVQERRSRQRRDPQHEPRHGGPLALVNASRLPPLANSFDCKSFDRPAT